MNLREFCSTLRSEATEATAVIARSFFKTGRGEYGEGDKFLGLKVPQVRALVKLSDNLAEDDVLTLLRSEWHEERLAALQIMVSRFQKAKRDEAAQARWVKLYLANTAHINNWDLVDTSAPHILGTWLLTHDRTILGKLARSKELWERRISVIATQALIRAGEFDDTLRLVRMHLRDPHDLMHKACGWMLREVGKKNKGALVSFLTDHAHEMPRTMLRYSIERFTGLERARWMRKTRLKSGVTD